MITWMIRNFAIPGEIPHGLIPGLNCQPRGTAGVLILVLRMGA